MNTENLDLKVFPQSEYNSTKVGSFVSLLAGDAETSNMKKIDTAYKALQDGVDSVKDTQSDLQNQINILQANSGELGAHDVDPSAHEDIRTSISNHSNDTTKHITSVERAAWSAQADWSVNDESDPAYVKNRVCYTGDRTEVTLIEEKSVSVSKKSQLSGSLALEEGKTYTVVFDGTEYECTAWSYDGDVYIGNGSIRGDSTKGNGEPFCFYSYSSGSIYLNMTAEGTYTVSIKETVDGIETTLIDNESVTIAVSGGSVKAEIYGIGFLEEGKTYIVNFNGVDYECTSWFYDDDVYIGNGSIRGDSTKGNGEPFCIRNWDELYLYMTTLGTYTLSIAEVSIPVVQIDPKYLPMCYTIPSREATLIEEQSISSDEDGSGSCSGEAILEEGKTYIVNFDGTSYECIAWYHANWDEVCVGNGSLVGDDSHISEEPFCLDDWDGSIYLYVPEAGEHTISIIGTIGGDTQISYDYLQACAPASHSNNADIHVTEDDKYTWNNKAQKPRAIIATLSSANWDSSNLTQTVSVPGVSPIETSQIIIPTPMIASQGEYYKAGIMCTGQGLDSLTFTCKAVPTTDLTVYVTIQEVIVS